MRDHAAIVRGHGAQALARLLNEEGFEVAPTTPQRWADRNSIPGEYWNAISEHGIATLDELAGAADGRRNRQCGDCERIGEEIRACTDVHCPLAERQAA